MEKDCAKESAGNGKKMNVSNNDDFGNKGLLVSDDG